MKYKITKLDRRHNGYTWYKYSVSPNTVDRIRGGELLIEVRNWLWATYGPSAEIGFTNRWSLWAWDTEHNNRRLYIKGDEELTMFKLKFGD
jgi:hypothetical protein